MFSNLEILVAGVLIAFIVLGCIVCYADEKIKTNRTKNKIKQACRIIKRQKINDSYAEMVAIASKYEVK